MTRFAALLAMMLIAACAGSPSATRTALPTWCETGSCVGIPADPVRTATLRESSGCVWVEFDGQKARALWPKGFTATSQPFIVYDRSDREIGRDGSRISTQMLGPDSAFSDACGLTQTINLYFPDADSGGIGDTSDR